MRAKAWIREKTRYLGGGGCPRTRKASVWAKHGCEGVSFWSPVWCLTLLIHPLQRHCRANESRHGAGRHRGERKATGRHMRTSSLCPYPSPSRPHVPSFSQPHTHTNYTHNVNRSRTPLCKTPTNNAYTPVFLLRDECYSGQVQAHGQRFLSSLHQHL